MLICVIKSCSEEQLWRMFFKFRFKIATDSASSFRVTSIRQGSNILWCQNLFGEEESWCLKLDSRTLALQLSCWPPFSCFIRISTSLVTIPYNIYCRYVCYWFPASSTIYLLYILVYNYLLFLLLHSVYYIKLLLQRKFTKATLIYANINILSFEQLLNSNSTLRSFSSKDY